MKALFLIFHGFEESNGISKKIRYQTKALKANGLDVKTCYLIDDKGHKLRMIDDTVLQDYGNGIRAKILKRVGLGCISKYVTENKIEMVYIRSDHHATPFLVALLRRIRKNGAKIALEIPTYPYDHEYDGLPLSYQWVHFLDKCFRKKLVKHVDKIITFSNDKLIFGRPTIEIANGIDFEAIPLKEKNNITFSNEIHFIAVATIHPWHGFDRAIQGLATYYRDKSPDSPKIFLHIVGEGVPIVINEYHKLVSDAGLEEYVFFHGPLYGDALNNIFNQCQLGIGSLARHRSGITHLRSLKNREYAARGIPFVYSEIDEDFENMPYIMKVPADESPLNIQAVVDFLKSVSQTPDEIRNSIMNTLSWNIQMKKVIDEL